MSTRKRIKDPLVGFGWAGYVCAAILLALIAALVAGIELRYELLKLILHALGVDAMMSFAAHLPFFGFAIFGVSVSVTTGACALVAFKIAPYRINPLLQLLVFFLCAGWYLVPLKLFMFVGRVFPVSAKFGIGFSLNTLEVVGVALIGTLVCYMTRSRLIGAMWSLAVALATVNALWLVYFGANLPGSVVLFTAFSWNHYTSLSLVFDLLTIGSLLLWAIFERRKIVPDQMCDFCGYDIAGLSSDAACPECGHLVPTFIP